jgi:hypothetical protein
LTQANYAEICHQNAARVVCCAKKLSISGTRTSRKWTALGVLSNCARRDISQPSGRKRSPSKIVINEQKSLRDRGQDGVAGLLAEAPKHQQLREAWGKVP